MYSTEKGAHQARHTGIGNVAFLSLAVILAICHRSTRGSGACELSRSQAYGSNNPGASARQHDRQPEGPHEPVRRSLPVSSEDVSCRPAQRGNRSAATSLGVLADVHHDSPLFTTIADRFWKSEVADDAAQPEHRWVSLISWLNALPRSLTEAPKTAQVRKGWPDDSSCLDPRRNTATSSPT
jgi:hypothetical protein